MNVIAPGLPAWLTRRSSLKIETTMPAKEEHTDQDVLLMQSVAAGDEQALRMLINKWQGPLINFFYRSLQSVEQSEDLAQVTFVKLYKAAPRYQPTAKFSTYLFHIARRLLINEYRRQSRKPLEAVDPAEINISTPGRDKLAIMEIEEAFEVALKTLPENQKTAILLLKQQELSYEQIANIMDATETAVKTWIHRARKKLKEQLKDML